MVVEKIGEPQHGLLHPIGKWTPGLKFVLSDSWRFHFDKHIQFPGVIGGFYREIETGVGSRSLSQVLARFRAPPVSSSQRVRKARVSS